MKTLEMKTMTSILGPMTAMERLRGRYMRAPDHSAGDDGAGGGDGGSSDGDGSADGGEGGDGALSTEEQLAKEFGDDTSGEGDGNDDGEGDEDEGSHADDTGEDDNGEDGGEGDDGNGSEDGEGEGQSQNRAEQRIKEHEAARREAERKASEATREAEKWRRIAEGAPQAPEAPADGEKDPNAEPDPADFEFGVADPEYIAAKAEYKALTRLRQEGEDARIKAELNGLEAKYQAAVPAALEKYPDYDEVVTKGAEGENPAWVCPPIVALGIRDSEVGTDIAYHLAKNPEESRRIAGLNNLEQAREFGRLEGGFLRDKKDADKKAEDGNKGEGNGAPPPKKRSAAPPPPKKNIARGAGGKFSVPPDTDDFAAFDRTYGN